MLAERLNAKLILENFEENPFLEKFYLNPEEYAFRTQMFFLLERYSQLQELHQKDLFQNFILSVRSEKNFFGLSQIADATDAAPSRTMLPSSGSACTAALRRMPLRSPSLR